MRFINYWLLNQYIDLSYMELKEFIEDTLLQIINGVKVVQDKTKETESLAINPESVTYSHGSVDFEVALTKTEGNEGRAGIGVWFGNIGLGGQQKTDTQNVSVNNVKFSVPVILPRIGRLPSISEARDRSEQGIKKESIWDN